MASRLNLHEMFCTILGNRNVYFDPPPKVLMEYDAIRYSLSKIDNEHANDSVYIQRRRYEVIVITEDPESDVVNKVSLLPYCSHDRYYVADGLHHNVFTLYY